MNTKYPEINVEAAKEMVGLRKTYVFSFALFTFILKSLNLQNIFPES